MPTHSAFLCIVLLGWLTPVGSAEPLRISQDGRPKLSPSFVRGGQQIIFSVRDIPNRVTLKLLTPSDGSEETLVPGTAAHQWDGTISLDGRYLCFARSARGPQLQLVIQDRQQNTEAVFSPSGARSTVRSPSIAPDNSRVVFSISAPGGQQIASVNMKGGDLRKLTRSAGINTGPAYSPDGKHVVFSSSRTGDLEICVMDAEGSGVRRLTRSPRLDIHPAWSPDGMQIAFTSIRDGNYEVYVMNADGSGLKNVTRHPERDDFPSWHPDGKRILTVSERGGRFDLYLFEVPE